MLMMAKGKFHPWLALTLAILAGAALLVLLLEQPGREAASPPSASTESPEPATAAGSKLPGATPAIPHQAEISPELLGKFRRHLRGSMLRRYGLDWMDASSGKELFLDGHIREAMAQAQRELARRTANGDRDAAALLLDLRLRCDDPQLLDTQRDLAERAPQNRQRLQAIADRLSPAARAKALVAIDVDAEQSELLTSYCQGPAPVDMTDLEEQVRRAASDGHTPSLEAMATIAAANNDAAARERYLLSASLLGDSKAQWRLAHLYRKRLATNASPDDRGKMRFWLEQAFDKIPAAAFELGDCLRAECDGQPANPERAQRLIESAARQGDPLAIRSMMEGTDGSASDKFSEFAWLDFRARLAEEGCNIDDFLIARVSDERDRTRSAFYPNERSEADQRAQDLYDRYGGGARTALGCD